MKKVLLVISLFVTLLGSASAQSSVYVKFRGGYGIGASKDGYLVDLNQGIANATSKENIFASLGQGIPLGISGGYMLNPHMGFELDFTYMMGDKVTVMDYNIPSVAVISAKAFTRHIQASPNFVMASGGDRFNVYTKVGFVFPFVGKSYVEVTNATDPTKLMFIRQDIKGDPSMGYKGALGVDVKIASKVAFFTEIEGVHLKILRSEHDITKFTVNGNDMLANYTALTGKAVKVKYYDRLEGADLTDPSKALKTTSPYGKIGLNFGLKFTL
ncbi:MAG: outer membrane beta-barrel protein [Bacteroidota bacterium]|nr:outer membrane beta-barrel protein [Bacteroidota bacterium]